MSKKKDAATFAAQMRIVDAATDVVDAATDVTTDATTSDTTADTTDVGKRAQQLVQNAVEKSYGVKVKVAEATEDRGKLLDLEALIHEQMADQEEAVAAKKDARKFSPEAILAEAKARLSAAEKQKSEIEALMTQLREVAEAAERAEAAEKAAKEAAAEAAEVAEKILK